MLIADIKAQIPPPTFGEMGFGGPQTRMEKHGFWKIVVTVG